MQANARTDVWEEVEMRVAWLEQTPAGPSSTPGRALWPALVEAGALLEVFPGASSRSEAGVRGDLGGGRVRRPRDDESPHAKAPSPRWPPIRLLPGPGGQQDPARAFRESRSDAPYDVIYLTSYVEVLALGRDISHAPPVILHAQTHAAGALRCLFRSAPLAGSAGSRTRWLRTAAMLCERSIGEIHGLRRVAAIVTPSRVFAHHLRRDYGIPPDRLHVVANSVDLARWTPRERHPVQGPVKLVCASGAPASGGCDSIVALSQRLSDLAGKVELEVLVAQEKVPELRLLLSGLKPEVARCRVLLPSEDVLAVYQAAELVIDASRYEPFGQGVAQALACGVPVVASDAVGACEDVDPQCCAVFVAGDLAGLESAVRGGVDRCRSLRTPALSALARDEAERLFSPAVVGKKLAEVFDRVHHGSPSRVPSTAFPICSRVAATARKRLPVARAWGSGRKGERSLTAVEAAMGDPELLEAFRAGGPLPRELDPDVSERIVEWPWLLAQAPVGRLLDAGSTLNHAHVLHRIRPLVEGFDIVTLAPEARNFPEVGVSYLYADLRKLPLRDASYDTVACLSVLEHVGLDNSMYGAGAAAREQPQAAAKGAMRELRRVTRPGGVIAFTVPYGIPQDCGWVRQFDERGLRDLIAAASPAEAHISVFRLQPRGWERSDLRTARAARYAGWQASAVACVRLAVPE
jgi:glycosyltransferase involved in cell wall biosynthesis/SAM-dependent methyltransferase